MSVRYLALDDYLAIAVEVTGQQVATIVGAADLALADSALHAPMAGFSGRELYPDFVDKAAVLIVRLAKNHPLPDGNARRLGVAAGVRRAQRLDDRALPLCRRGRSRRPRHRYGRLGRARSRQLAPTDPSPTATVARLPGRPGRPLTICTAATHVRRPALTHTTPTRAQPTGGVRGDEERKTERYASTR